MQRWTWTLGILVVAGVATAFAQPPGGPGGRGGPGGGPGGPGGQGGPPPNPVIEALDVDHDHVISADELKNAPAALLALDKNKDGKLTEDEFRPMGRGPGGPGGQGGNQGGGQGGAGGRGRGQGGQAGGPGQRGQGGGPGAGGPGREGPGGPPGGPGGPDPERMMNHAMEFDADKDGKLSKDELQKFIDDFVKHHAGGPPGGPGGPGGGAGGPPSGGQGERTERPKRPD